jgi:hypothetical protein
LPLDTNSLPAYANMRKIGKVTYSDGRNDIAMSDGADRLR